MNLKDKAKLYATHRAMHRRDSIRRTYKDKIRDAEPVPDIYIQTIQKQQRQHSFYIDIIHVHIQRTVVIGKPLENNLDIL
jgi:hypothetical protein